MPIGQLRIDLGYQTSIAFAFLPLIAVALVSPALAVFGALALSAFAVAPTVYGAIKVEAWRKTAATDISKVDIDAFVTPGAAFTKIVPDLPTLAADVAPTPAITSVTTTVDASGSVKLQIQVADIDVTTAHVIFRMPTGADITLSLKDFAGIDTIQVSPIATAEQIDVYVPQGVLLGAAKIIVAGLHSQSYVESAAVTVANKGGYSFVGDVRGPITPPGAPHYSQIDVLGPVVAADGTVDANNQHIIKTINLPEGSHPYAVVVTDDLSRVFVATEHGIDVIDGFTFQMYGHIDIGGDDIVTAIAVDPAGHTLYAAGTGRVVMIDIEPGSANFDRYIAGNTLHLGPFLTNNLGYISTIALNADGTRLFVGSPGSRFFGGDQLPITQGGNVHGVVLVINTDPLDAADPVKSHYHDVLASLDGGVETWKITASSDPLRMLFTSRGSPRAATNPDGSLVTKPDGSAVGGQNQGLHTIVITQNDPTRFAATVNTISLVLNAQPVGVRSYSLPGPDGAYDIGSFAKRSNDQVFDLDIRNATGIAVLPDLSYAFVADYYLSRIFNTSDTQYAQAVEDLHETGSKIGIVKDPFGPHPTLVAATTPIPFGFLDDIALDASGSKLYAAYRAAGTVLVFDVKTLIAKSKLYTDNTLKQKPIDNPNVAGGTVNLPGIDVPNFVRGLAVQKVAAITLLAPLGEHDVDSVSPDQLVFTWSVDTALLGISSYTSNLYVSAEQAGEGLWNDDPARVRVGTPANGVAFDPKLNTQDDTNPTRIFTSLLQYGKPLESGFTYTVALDRSITQGDALADKHMTKVIFSKDLSHILTAGQTYYWGVVLTNPNTRAASAFSSAPVKAISPYGVVTVLTHGFQFGSQILPNQESTTLQAPEPFLEMGQLIADAGGGGVVLQYNKQTGQWQNDKGVAGAAALIDGKSVVLVTDWKAESDISDSGFSEAAADAMFASLVDLNNQTKDAAHPDGKLFLSQFHFIGHSRGTSVNSEIVQRMGTYFPSVPVYMTSLDAHDFTQSTLDIPLANVLQTVLKLAAVAKFVALSTLAEGNVTAVAEYEAFQILQDKLQKGLDFVASLGIQINPIEFGDFKDPAVTEWNNVVFADNYYQTAATNDQVQPSKTAAKLGATANFTATPNGRSIPAADIDENLNKLSGFGSEDFPLINAGLGGPHSRVWQWYAGTINTSIQSFGGGLIWRRLADTGLRATSFGLPLVGQEYSTTGWYYADPSSVIGTNLALRVGAASNGEPLNNATTIKEGVGTGFYFAPDGGGVAYDPLAMQARTAVAFDNTKVAHADGVPAVTTVFNGDFESGTKQSLWTHLTDPSADFGRFPLSYQLPGWSFHGGSGFQVGITDIGATIDVTGLFVVNTDVAGQLAPIANTYIDQVVDKLVTLIEDKYKKSSFVIPPIPGVAAAQADKDKYDALFGPKGTFTLEFAEADALSAKIDELLKAGKAGILGNIPSFGGGTLADIFKFDGKNFFNPKAIEDFKKYLHDNAALLLQDVFGTGSGDAIFLGGTAILQGVLTTAFNALLANKANVAPIISTVISEVANFDTLTHNRLFVPTTANYLDFDLVLPLVLSPTAGIEVTISLDDGGVLPGVVQAATRQTFTIDAAFFERRTLHMAVPDFLRGHMATITFKQINFDSTLVAPILQDPDGNPVSLSDQVQTTVSQLFFLDNIRCSALPDGQTPQVGVVSAGALGLDVKGLTLDDVSRIAELAKANWINSNLVAGAADTLAKVKIEVGLLSDSVVGDYADDVITIDATAAGAGWFLGGEDQFTAGPSGTFVALSGSDAAAKFDLLTVLEHEYGHALGIADFADGVIDGALMNTSLHTGVRILPSAKDLTVQPVVAVVAAPVEPVVTQAQALAKVPAISTVVTSAAFASNVVLSGNSPVLAGTLQNGAFSVTDKAAAGFAWTSTGTVNVAPGHATLGEDRTTLSTLAQTFTLANGQTTLSFTIFAGQLYQDAGRAPDAFEVALRDSVTGISVLGSLGLSQTDDLLNLQANGTLFLAPGVSVTGLTADGRLDLSAGAHIVTVDVSSVARLRNLALDFTLVTFGTHPAAITLGDVGGAVTTGPLAIADAATVNPGASILIDVLANDGGTGLTLTGVSAPAHGTAVIEAGRVRYTAGGAYVGADAFAYTTTDGHGLTATANVAVTVFQTIVAPAPTGDTATVTAGRSVLIDVLSNDTGTGLSLTTVGTPGHGAAVIEGVRIRYTPAAGYVGSDSFTYGVTGVSGQTAMGSVVVTVMAIASPPVAVGDTAGVISGTSVLIDVLGNDLGLGLSLTGVTSALHGTAVIQGGRILYTAASGYDGPDSVTYTATDVNGQTASAVLAVTVVLVIVPPGPVGDVASVLSGQSVTIDVLANDVGTGLSLTGVGVPLHGSAVIQAGKIVYTAAADYVGADSFGYTVTGQGGASAEASVAVTVGAGVLPATNLAPSVFSPSLLVAENAGPTAIGIALPSDPVADVTTLTVTLTRLPGNGRVTLANGTAVVLGQVIGASDLAGLLFTPTAGTFGVRSTLAYSVADPAGNATTGQAALVVGPALGAPVVSQPSVTAPFGGSSVALGIGGVTDLNFTADLLTILVQALPTNGIVTLADGVTPVMPGQALAASDLAGLRFLATGPAGSTSSLTYRAVDPSGNASLGVVAIAIGPQTTATPPTLAFLPPDGTGPATLAITNVTNPVFTGMAAAGNTITLQGGTLQGVMGSGVTDANGAFTITPSGIGGVGVTGSRLSVSAVAAVTGLSGSAPSGAVGLLVLPATRADGTILTDLSSLDIATALHAGYGLHFTPGTEAVLLTDGVLSVGPDTNEAYLQRLYMGVLGRAYDAAGMTYWDAQMAAGMDKTAVAGAFLASNEHAALPAGSVAFVTALYAGVFGRAPDAAGLAYWTSAPAQAQGTATIARLFADSPEAKGIDAFATAKIFARSTPGTLIHDLYETGLGREVEIAGLAYWTQQLASFSTVDVAAQILSLPEPAARHAGQSDAQFAADLIQTGYGRAATPAELSSATTRLAAGLSRAALLLEIGSGAETRAHWTSDDMGEPPVIAAVAPVTTAEGQPVAVTLAGRDPDRTADRYSLVSGPVGSSVDPVTGQFTWVSGTAPSQNTVTVALTDPTGLAARRSFAVNVTATPPVLSVTGPGAAIAGTASYVTLASQARAPGAVVGAWSVAWGDGSTDVVSGTAAQPSHVYAEPGRYQVQATAITAGYGSFAAPAVTMVVTADSFSATAVTAEATGFHARFTGVIDPASLSLPTDSTGPAPSVIVTTAAGVIVPGSLVLDPDGAGVRFIAAASLPAGAYKVTFRATLRDLRGRAIDGNADGTAGDDLAATFTIRTSPDALAVPAFMQGPAQSTGLPVTFTSDGTATRVVFTASFNPALLQITGATAAAGLPAGATIGFTTVTLADGRTQATVTVTSTTPIPAGAQSLLTLTSQVPATAAYGATEVLSLAIVSVNGVAQALPETSGLHVVGYLGDADGSGTLTATDATRILRVVGGADSGFAAWRGVAPTVIADLNADGALTAADATRVATATTPAGVTLVTASATPFVSAPTTLAAAAGGTVTVPVTLDRAVTLASGQITLRYDTTALTLTAVRADPSSGLTVTAGPASAGSVTVTASRTTAAATSGVLALFDFQVAAGLAAGTTLALDLSAVTLDGAPLASRPGADGTDGRVLVTPAAGHSVTFDLAPPAADIAAADIAAADTTTLSPTRAAQALLLSGTAA